MDCIMPGLPVLLYLPVFIQTHIHWVDDAIQPSHPLSPTSPPAFNLSQQQGLFQWVSSLPQVTKVLELQVQPEIYKDMCVWQGWGGGLRVVASELMNWIHWAHVPELQRGWASTSILFSGLVYKEGPDNSTVRVPAPQIVIHVSAGNIFTSRQCFFF